MRYTALIFVLTLLNNINIYAQNIDLQVFATNLDRPVNIKHASDDRLFVVEQEGIIQIININGSLNPVPFLNITNKVGAINNIGDERGLLGLAFHPDYITNGYFFVNYINSSGDTVISRFETDTSNIDQANPNSELIILTISQPFSNHNGGDMAFGNDGYLYISSGDGGSGGDPQNNAQNTSNLLGKILRIDIDSTTMSQNYTIPANNPFVDIPEARDEIWAYGLRNPWKFSFDSLNGDIWIADVGQGNYEEINRSSAIDPGLNYGWRCYEGNNSFNGLNCPDPSNFKFPLAVYSHSNNGLEKCSITGGYRYRGTEFTSFYGWYFFADYCSGEIGYLIYNNSNDTWNMTFEQFYGNWSAFGEDVNGELYVADIQSGNIYKLTNNILSTDENNLNNLYIYPNPVKDELIIKFSQNNTVILDNILIYNLQGRLIIRHNDKNKNFKQINTNLLTKGIYILQLNSSNGTKYTYKLIKH